MSIINLTKDLLIGEGSHRSVYLLPKNIPNELKSDSQKCIKVDGKIKALRNKAKNKRWYKQWRPVKYFGENHKEIKGYKKLAKKNPIVFSIIPRFYGVYKTNMGEGMVVDYINNSISLKKYIREKGVSNGFLAALKDFISILVNNRVEIRDFFLDNYIVKEILGKPHIYLIDGIGNANFIPISEWIPFVGKMKIIRRVNKILQGLRNDFPKYSEYFSLEYLNNCK